MSHHEDDHKKIYKTKIGLITGAGSIPLLDAVKDQLGTNEKFNEVTDTNAILQVVEEARFDYSNFGWLEPEHDIASTGWIFTYNTIIDNKPKLRLATIHPSLGKGIIPIAENSPQAIYPLEATKDQVEIIHQFLTNGIRKSQEFAIVNESIQYHTSLIASIIRHIQPMFPSISANFQIGIHLLDGSRAISDIVTGNTPFCLKFER